MSKKEKTIEVERDFPVSVEELFDYWTDINLVKFWLSPKIEIDPERFYKLAYDFDNNKYRVLAVISKFIYPELLVFRWLMQKKVTHVEINFAPLSPVDSNIKIIHTFPKGYPEISPGHPGDWEFFLDKLDKLIKTNESRS